MTRIALLGAVFLGWCALASAEKKDIQVSQNSDDAEENVSNGNMSLNSSDLELISDGSTAQFVGMRFQSIEIPQGATILSAHIEFETDETNSGATSVTIQGQDIDDAPTFTNSNSGFDSLGELLVRQDRGGAVAVWAPAGLTAHGQSKVLAQLFLEHTFLGENERLGDAVVSALEDYAEFPDSKRRLRTFNLLGDPALILPR